MDGGLKKLISCFTLVAAKILYANKDVINCVRVKPKIVAVNKAM